MSSGQTNSTEAQADFMAGNPPGQLEMLQRALQHSKTDSQEKDRKLRESATTICSLEDGLEKESMRNYELETDQRDKTSEIKELRTLLKKKGQDYALLQQTHRAAEEQSEKDEQNISTLRQTIKKQRDQLESTQREIRQLDKGNGQLQKDLARAQQQTENAYQQGFDEAHSLIKEISTIENPGPWGASEATSAYSSARLSTNSGSREDNLNYAQSHTSQSQNGYPSQTSDDDDPGLTLDQELADLTDGSDIQNGYESPWTGSQHTDAQSNTNDDDKTNNNNHQSALAPEPYQGDSRQIGPPGMSELATELTATETACKSDTTQSEAPSRPHSQPQQSPCTQNRIYRNRGSDKRIQAYVWC